MPANSIEFVEPPLCIPSKTTDHSAPWTNPTSVNVTLNLAGLNVTSTDWAGTPVWVAVTVTTVLAGTVGTKQIHDMAVRLAITTGYPIRDDLVINTGAAHRVAAAQAQMQMWA